MDRLSRLNFAFSVANNELGPKGAKILADMLHVNSSSMTFLDLSSNKLCGVSGSAGQYGTYDTTGIKGRSQTHLVSVTP